MVYFESSLYMVSVQNESVSSLAVVGPHSIGPLNNTIIKDKIRPPFNILMSHEQRYPRGKICWCIIYYD